MSVYTPILLLLFMSQGNKAIKDSDHMAWVEQSLMPDLVQIAREQQDASGFRAPADERTVQLAKSKALRNAKPSTANSPLNDAPGPGHAGFVRGRRVTERQHWDWFLGQIKAIRSVRAGMSRKEMLRFVTTEGGLSSRTRQSFVGKGCPELKVDVMFRASSGGVDSDTVASVSIPHVDYMVMD
ncbi:MAG: hypothetical protein P4L46_14225 [Fimbriimonas sp.]|nr:hypothetical protein [Fimbriimonas sp.]